MLDEAVLEFDEIFRMMRAEIRSYARRSVNESEVDDIVAEVFLTIWKKWDERPSEESGAVRGWVYNVARYKVMHARRAYARQSGLLFHVASDAMVPAQSPPDPAEVIVEREARISALKQLPDGERSALSLDMSGYSREEVADMLNCAITTVSNRISRARKRLA